MNRSFTHGPGIDDILGMTDYTGESPVDYFFHHDGLGSIVNITDASEVLKTTYTYSPFGEFTTTYNNGTIDSPFTYTGREFSSATGLFHNRAREYMPSIGQFTSRDSYPYDKMEPNTIQRYSYCGNSPVNFVDPWGLINLPSMGTQSIMMPMRDDSGDPIDPGWYEASGGGFCAGIFSWLWAKIKSGCKSVVCKMGSWIKAFGKGAGKIYEFLRGDGKWKDCWVAIGQIIGYVLWNLFK